MNASGFSIEQLSARLSRAAGMQGAPYLEERAQALAPGVALLPLLVQLRGTQAWQGMLLIDAWTVRLTQRPDCEEVEALAAGRFRIGYGTPLSGSPATFDRIERIVRVGPHLAPVVAEILFWERPWPDVRMTEALCGALAKLRDLRAVEPLSTLLREADVPLVRRASAEALGTGGFAESWAALAREMSDPSSDEEVKRACARSLGMLRDERAMPALTALLARADISRELRGIAMRALAKTGAGRAVAPLASLLSPETPEFDPAEAAGALAQTGSTEAVPVLEGLLAHPEPRVREAARESLERLRRRLEPANSR